MNPETLLSPHTARWQEEASVGSVNNDLVPRFCGQTHRVATPRKQLIKTRQPRARETDPQLLRDHLGQAPPPTPHGLPGRHARGILPRILTRLDA